MCWLVLAVMYHFLSFLLRAALLVFISFYCFHLRMGECREMSIVMSLISLYSKTVNVPGIFTYKLVDLSFKKQGIHKQGTRYLSLSNQYKSYRYTVYDSLCQAASFIHSCNSGWLMLNWDHFDNILPC